MFFARITGESCPSIRSLAESRSSWDSFSFSCDVVKGWYEKVEAVDKVHILKFSWDRTKKIWSLNTFNIDMMT